MLLWGMFFFKKKKNKLSLLKLEDNYESEAKGEKMYISEEKREQ